MIPFCTFLIPKRKLHYFDSSLLAFPIALHLTVGHPKDENARSQEIALVFGNACHPVTATALIWGPWDW